MLQEKFNIRKLEQIKNWPSIHMLQKKFCTWIKIVTKQVYEVSEVWAGCPNLGHSSLVKQVSLKFMFWFIGDK